MNGSEHGTRAIANTANPTHIDGHICNGLFENIIRIPSSNANCIGPCIASTIPHTRQW